MIFPIIINFSNNFTLQENSCIVSNKLFKKLSAKCILENFLFDIHASVMNFADSCCQVCRDLKDICSCDSLWRPLCSKYWASEG